MDCCPYAGSGHCRLPITEDWQSTTKTQNGPQALACGPSGGLFGIDQEVVTHKASAWDAVATSANSGSRRDLTPGGSFQTHR